MREAVGAVGCLIEGLVILAIVWVLSNLSLLDAWLKGMVSA